MEAHKHGRDVVLVYNKDIREALHKACEHDNDNEAITLSRAASIVRRDMLKMKLTFNCSFGSDSTPASLLALVYMGLYGASITSQTTVSSTPQPALTILQLLRFNSSACKKVKQSPDVPRHNAARETPLPIYLGIMLHSKTRKRELVDKLFELGLTRMIVCLIYLQSWATKYVIIMRQKVLSVLLSLRAAFLQLLQ